MIRAAILGAALLAASAAAAAASDGDNHYSVRNGTSRHFTCAVRHAHGRPLYWFVLRAGAEWQEHGRSGGIWTLRCDTLLPTTHFLLRPGVRYELASNRRGWVELRTLPQT